MNSYFLTYGRGMISTVVAELELIKEKHKKVQKSIQIQIDERDIEGKLAFHSNLPQSSLINLRTAERLFISILFTTFAGITISSTFILDFIKENFKFDFNSYTPFNNDDFQTGFDVKRARKIYKFRVDCRMTGRWKKASELKTQIIEILTSRVTESNPNMEVDLRTPDFWLTCHLSDLCLAIGLPITKQPLSSRSYLKHVGLRATICSAMIQSINYNPFDLIIDPFCGKGTIAAEMLFNIENRHDRPFWLCSDYSSTQLKETSENMSVFIENYDLIQANLSANSIFPYRNEIADIILSDFPFGKNHLIQYFSFDQDSSNKISLFYKKVLSEIDRILVKSGKALILINKNEIDSFKICFNNDKDKYFCNLELISLNIVSLGQTNGAFVKLVKS